MRLQIIGVLRAGGGRSFRSFRFFRRFRRFRRFRSGLRPVPEGNVGIRIYGAGWVRFCGPQRRGVRHFVRKCAVAGQINRRRACGFGAKSIYLRAGLLALGIFRRFRIFRSGPDGPFPEASGDSGSFRIFRIFRLFRFFRIFRPFRLFRSPISTFHPPF